MTVSKGQDPEASAQMVTEVPARPVEDPSEPHGTPERASQSWRPTVPPESVYQESARALVGRFRVGSQNAADVHGYVTAPWFRAAVGAAFAAGRRDAFVYELAQAEGCADALDRLPGQQRMAAFYRLHAEHIRAVMAQEPPAEGNPR